ncbi:hypothetical protein BDZ89DRAFT_1069203 [Hymenopellis radicata]|nr:hypothetical protein BDZ89DRAFT_1069203 [Hymenopellis radicata]
MRSAAIILFLGLAGVYALPTKHSRASNSVLLFDAPLSLIPQTTPATLISQQVDALTELTNIIKTGLALFGISGDDLSTAVERTKLFVAGGVSDQSVSVAISGCSASGVLTGTASSGLALQNVSVGTFSGQLVDDATTTSTVFASPDSGFGVISDIDDTVKVSHVLDKIALAKATLFEDPTPVSGMPDLYATLAQTLDDPNFIYISGSPFQLYPFLRDFLETSFPETRGPIFGKNLTLSDPAGILDLLFDDNDKFDFKLSQISRVQGMFPNKKFLTVGDSTEKDPETYGEAFRLFGDFIQCIWIRKV